VNPHALARYAGRFVRRFAHDARGVSAIEFALVGPVVLLLIIGTMEIALDMIVDASVQLAAQQASRTGLTNVTPSSGSRADQAKAVVTNILAPWTAIGGTVTIVERAYSSYNDVGGTNYQSTLGGFGDVVSYNISVTMPTFSGITKLFGVSQMTFQRNFIVQNEK
jgi:Flp pilus assembly protein TadG